MNEDPSEDPTRVYRLVFGIATALMMGLSWPLWVGPSELPRVPFVPSLPVLPHRLSWVLFVFFLGSLLWGAGAKRARVAWAIAGSLLAYLVLEDQHRFQPWAYQAIMTALALSACHRRDALVWPRCFLIALYLHSGLSKLDVSFLHELGPMFLNAGLRIVRLDPAVLPERFRAALILAMPLTEIAIAAALSFVRTRRAGAWAAVLLHLTLVLLLGPLGLRHSTIVLVWNAAVALEVLALFPRPAPEPRRGPIFVLMGVVFGAVALLPFTERLGWLDSWPSFALYASHAERMEVLLSDEEAERLEGRVRARLLPATGPGWRRLDLTAWSLQARGTPAYPQNRAGVGLVLGLARGLPESVSIRVVLLGRASPFSGRRSRREFTSIAELNSWADQNRINARPRRDEEGR